MRVKGELHPDVVWFLKRECTAKERSAFYQQLEKLRSDQVALIENSEAIHCPQQSRYILRFFRFEECMAVFEMNRERDRIRVRQCRRIPP
jgi:hypothetical protein